jgi:hypothetical protein
MFLKYKCTFHLIACIFVCAMDMESVDGAKHTYLECEPTCLVMILDDFSLSSHVLQAVAMSNAHCNHRHEATSQASTLTQAYYGQVARDRDVRSERKCPPLKIVVKKC